MLSVRRVMSEDFPELPDWVVPMKTVEKKLQSLRDPQLGKEIMNDYEQFLRKITDAFGDIKNGNLQPTIFDQSLGDSDLTLGWLIQHVQSIAPPTIDIRKVHCEVLSTDGFVSQIISIKLHTRSRNPISIIVKLPETRAIKAALVKTVGPKIAEEYLPTSQLEPFARGLVFQFNREIEFYSCNIIEGLKIPNVYFSQKWEYNKYTGALVMEDLSHLKPVSFFDSLSIPQIESLCEQLKILHVSSKEIVPQWSQKFPHPDNAMGVLCKLKEVVEVFVIKFPELLPVYQKIEHLYENKEFLEYALIDAHKELGMPDVLCHGDLWTYNFLWKADSDGMPSDQLDAIIDWQNIHCGSIGEDFGHMLVFCCDPDIRRKAEVQVLSRYFADLTLTMEAMYGYCGMTWKQFIRAYRIGFVVHALHLPFIANVMLSIKTADSAREQKARAQCLVNRTLAAWEDALTILATEMPAWAE